MLVNNAGYDEWAWFTNTDADLWQRVLAVNLVGVIACTHAVLGGMQERLRTDRERLLRGRPRRLERIGGLLGRQGGVLGFTKAIAIENGRYGITSNAVAPGPIETPL